MSCYETHKGILKKIDTDNVRQYLFDLTSNNDDSNDVKIVLKQDYYDFCDFAYYGSLSELFRASVTDILDRFPGELYCTSNNIYSLILTSIKIQICA